MSTSTFRNLVAAITTVIALGTGSARADEIIKIGLSVPLSGGGANWGKGAEWSCKRAAQEIKEAGGVKVKGKTYSFECLAYDNKYTAAEGTKVAQTLLNRDGVKFIAGSLGTAPAQAMQALTERQGALLMTTAWGMAMKGPKFPLTFTQMNTMNEVSPAVVEYVTRTHPEAKTIAILNPNDSTGREAEAVYSKKWADAGVKVIASDFYERGTTEFQPIAARIAALKADIVSMGSSIPGDAGIVFKELDVMGWKGVKVMEGGTGDSLKVTGGAAVNGVYMGASVTFDGPSASDRQRKINEEARAALGESLNIIYVAFFDAVYALRAGIEKAQSLNPAEVAAALPTVRFPTLYGGDSGFGGREVYGTPQQMILPVYVTQLQDGKIVERARIASKYR